MDFGGGISKPPFQMPAGQACGLLGYCWNPSGVARPGREGGRVGGREGPEPGTEAATWDADEEVGAAPGSWPLGSRAT